MLKKFLKLTFLSIFFLINCAMAAPNPVNHLTIQINNVSFKTLLPKHDFAYEMQIPDTEFFQGDPLAGRVSYSSKSILTSFYRKNDDNNIEVNLHVYDPAIGKRTIWKGIIIYNKVINKVEFLAEDKDDLHYLINIKLAQPEQGQSPQFLIDMISV